tara:strand:- start:1054 stop:1299 length:246 start_codon:yes stop_codon:yes gene_type:complete
MGHSFTAKQIIERATLITKTATEDKTNIKLVEAKMCPSTTALSQSLRGKKEVGKWFNKKDQLTEYFWVSHQIDVKGKTNEK